jgi:hypothetical protein
MGKLTWMMRQVTRDHRRLPGRLDQHADVMWSVARGRHESHTVNNDMIIIHEIDKPASYIGSTESVKPACWSAISLSGLDCQ